MEGVMIRDFRKTDIDRITEFKKESMKVSFPHLSLDTDSFRSDLLSKLDKDPESIKVAEKGGRVVGYVYFKVVQSSLGMSGVINHVFVEKDFRKTGLGTELMKLAEGIMRSRGVKRLRVTVTISNEPSINMCRKLGYQDRRVQMEKEL